MRFLRVSIAIGVLVSSTLVSARAGTADRTPPESTFLTPSGAVVVSTPLRADRVGGRAHDDAAGIASVLATFTPTTGVAATVRRADLGCDGSARTSCMWWAIPPYVPGTYSVSVAAVDRAGNLERPRHAIVITVL